MKRRSNLLAILLMFGACSLLRAQTVDLTAQTEPLVDLGKAQWRFHTGDDPRWADTSFDDSQWPLLAGNKTWDVQGYKGYGGYAWYRIHIKLPPNLQVSFAPGHVFDNFQVFADGKQIAHWGTLTPDSVPFYGQSEWSVVTQIPPHSGDLVIALRVWHWPVWAPYKTGGFGTVTKFFGSPVAVARQLELSKDAELARYAPHLILTLLSLLAGLFSLLLYAKQRSRTEYLWFGIFLLCMGLDFAWIFTVRHWIPQRLDIRNSISSLLSDLGPVAVILFLFRFIGSPVTRWARWYLVAQVPFALLGLLRLFTNFVTIGHWYLLVFPDVALAYFVLLWVVFTSWRRSVAARRLAIPLLLLTAADLVSLAYDNLYLLGIRAYSQPPVITSPFYLTSTDLAQFCFLAAMGYVLMERFAETQTEQARLQGEFESARTVQQVLIPDFLPPVAGLIVESAYLPAQEVGGDFFQVLPIPGGGDAFIVVGDVSGKGLKAAMTVSLLVGTLRTLAEYVSGPAEMLAGLNRRLHGRDAGFATCLVLKITPEGNVIMANAGHPNPYLDGVEVECENALPLGLSLDVIYPETRLQLDPTQSLTLVTDGVVEATAPVTRELFGFDRTQAISTQAADAIAEAARAFGFGGPQSDDITVLTITRTLGMVEAVV